MAHARRLALLGALLRGAAAAAAQADGGCDPFAEDPAQQ
eukprot:CAMPEP_0195109852 /NCGR_PEP_ID=MMETSP0448-20130528/90718_1 /TAXON_ID=66468 /ORGANISM="Heterocapsa triquestra, Strain CCMP 448" /LENGTH=38 /DNA_ID= /DNA_START= /DNA_END= /DNA_ORIENTATION=